MAGKREPEEIFVPNEVLRQIFSYLEVADVRSCRLACRQWYFCCEDKMITRAEKFVFRSCINPTVEINEFLTDLERQEVNVELVGIDLRELNFKSFGSKIEELALEDCILDVDTFKNIFYGTPNLRRFRMSTQTLVNSDSGSCFETTAIRSDVEVWVRGMNLLNEEKFQNFNMKEFKWNGYEKRLMNLLGCRLSHFLSMFPRLQSIHLWDSFSYTDIPEFRYLLPTATTITNLGGTFVMNVDSVDQSETFASFSRLKSLDVNIRFSAHSSLSVCEKLFSQTVGLEELTCGLLAFGEDEHTAQRRGEVAKAVIFQILKSCVKLNTLSFETSFTDPHICLNREEMGQLSASIKKIRKLRLSTIMKVEADIGEPLSCLPSTDGRLKDLEFEISCGPSDVGYRIMEAYQLTGLSLRIDSDCFCTYFEKILQSQKCLQRLEIDINPEDYEPNMDTDSKEVIRLKHESLNHLEYVCDVYGESWSKNHFRKLLTCDLPNLRTLKLYASSDDSEDDDFEDDGLNKDLIKWLQKMTSLTKVDLKLPKDLLDFKECLPVVGNMRHLQIIVLAFPNPFPHKEVWNLFQLLSNLKSILYVHEGDFKSTASIFKYHRAKKQLFERKGALSDNDVGEAKNLYYLRAVLLN